MPYHSAVGIDVSKRSLDVSLLSDNDSFHKKFSNSLSGISSIHDFFSQHEVEPTAQVVMESTGDYHLLCAHNLSSQFNVKVINPLLAKHHMQTTVRKVKTDKIDSYQLAELGLKQLLPTVKITKKSIQKQKLVTFIDTLEKHIAALKLTSKNLTATLRAFNVELEANEEITKQIAGLSASLSKAHDELYELVEDKQLVDELTSVRGISKHTATKVIALLEDRTFETKKALVAFTGLDVATRESGEWRGRARITKRGSSQLRKYLIQIGWGLLMHNEYFQMYIEKHKAKGRKYKELLVILARKFLRMLYGAMSTKVPFDAAQIKYENT